MTTSRRTDIEEADPGDDSGINLDLDEVSAEDLEMATREAMAAVEAHQSGEHEMKSPPGTRAAAAASAGPDDAEVGVLLQEIAELRDRSMRTLADFDNYRKRVEREREEARRFAAAAPLGDLLEVLDNLRLAIAAGGSADDLKRGVELIQRQFEEILRRHGVREIEAVDKPFDPVLHEAVAREEDPDVTTPTVRSELRRGYLLQDRLLRAAMVRVAVPPARPTGGADGAGDGGRA